MSDDPARCGVCGLPHPHLTVCPHIAEQEVREEYASDGRRRRLAGRIVRTRYFARPALFDAVIAAQTPEETPDAEAEGGQDPEAEAAQP